MPLVIKPAASRSRGIAPGSRVEGVFDLVDLLPTLLELEGLDVPGELDGRSRLAHLRSGAPIPDHDSLAVDISGVARSIHRGGLKLVRSGGHHRLSEQWSWRPGESRLFDTREDPEDSRDLSSALPEKRDELLARLGDSGEKPGPPSAGRMPRS